MKEVQALEVRENVGDRFTHATVKHDDGILEEFDLTRHYAGLHYAWITLSNRGELRLVVNDGVILHRAVHGNDTRPLVFISEDEDGNRRVTSHVVSVGDTVLPWTAHPRTGALTPVDGATLGSTTQLPTVESITVAGEYLQ